MEGEMGMRRARHPSISFTHGAGLPCSAQAGKAVGV